MSLSALRNGGRSFRLTSLNTTGFSTPEWVVSSNHISKKSKFVGRAARVYSIEEAVYAVKSLYAGNKKIEKSTHNMVAYRLVTPNGNILSDQDDDGEQAAGSKIAGVLEAMDTRNVVVVVSRWHGGVMLGPERFRLITAAAKEAVGMLVKEEGR